MIEKIKQLIQGGEKLTVELKHCENALSSSVYETVSSFSNRYGGYIILGVEDDKTISGVNPVKVEQLKKDFTNALNNPQLFAPTLLLSLDEVVIDGKVVLWCYIPSNSQLVIYKGKIFDRSGSDGDYEITRNSEMVAHIHQRKTSEFTERKIFPYVSEDQMLIKELMPRVRIMAQTRNPEHPWLDMTDEEIIQSADLYGVDPLTGAKGYNLAGILLFGKDKTIFSCCPGYVTDCILRKENLDRYDDRLMVVTNIIDAFNQILGFIAKYTPDPFYLEGAQTVSVRGKIAREIVSNSLCHREYSTTIPARIIIERERIFADNWNRSNLHGRLELATFTPQPKNPILARFFVNIGYADVLGSGMRNLYKYTPIFSNGRSPELVEGDKFQTIVPLPEWFAKQQSHEDVNEVVNEVVNEAVNRQTLIINAMRENPRVAIKQLVGLTGISKSTIEREIKAMKDIKIKRVGSDKTGHWELIE